MASTKVKSKTKTTGQNVSSFAIIACPMSKCEIRHVAGVGVLMRFHYIERAEQFKTGKHTTLQLVLDPEQGLEIEEAFKKSAQALKFGMALKQSLRAGQVQKSILSLAAESVTQVPEPSCASGGPDVVMPLAQAHQDASVQSS